MTKFTKGRRGPKKGVNPNTPASGRGKPKTTTPRLVDAKKVSKASGVANINPNAKSKPKPKRSNYGP
jgi:hypothetical protein